LLDLSLDKSDLINVATKKQEGGIIALTLEIMEVFNYILVKEGDRPLCILRVEKGSPEELKTFDILVDKGYSLSISDKDSYDALVRVSDYYEEFDEMDLDLLDQIDFGDD